jgi:hypothetical protein
MLRRLIAVTVLVGSVAVGGATTPAWSHTADQTTCDASLQVLFRPGLTFSETSQQIRAKGSLSNCVGGGVLSATATGNGSGSLSCTSGTATANASVRWNTGQVSKIQFFMDVSNGSVTGTVVSGLFAGEDVTGSLTITPVQGDCLFNPVTKATATGTVTI